MNYLDPHDEWYARVNGDELPTAPYDADPPLVASRITATPDREVWHVFTGGAFDASVARQDIITPVWECYLCGPNLLCEHIAAAQRARAALYGGGA